MASPINCLSILVIPLLVTSLFYQVSAGPVLDEAFLRTVCQKTKDPEFCFSTLNTDPRTFTGPTDVRYLVVVSIAIVNDAGQVTVDQIPRILSGLSDQLDRTRMENCQQEFNDALETVRNTLVVAFAGSNNYKDMRTSVINATIEVAACDNSYKNPPVRVSPIADANTDVLKKFDIAVAVIDTISALP